MQKVTLSLLTVASCLLPFSQLLLGAEAKAVKPASLINEGNKKPTPLFEPFTGKVTKNKVRLRLQPNFEGSVLRELNRGELLIVNGENEDFYSIQPPSNLKAYIYRTYVLDNVIEGTKVNVRLKPDLEAPVVAQLNSGDHVNGTINSSSPKWVEIPIPTSARFYVAKDYIEKVGDAGFIARTEKRREEVTRLLNTTNSVSAAEMQKPFDQVNLDGIVTNYKHIMLDYPDFPEIADKAKNALAALQESYMNKKIAYLESQANQSSQVLEHKNKQMAEELKIHKSKISQLEQQIQQEKQPAPVEVSSEVAQSTLPGRKTVSASYPATMLAWMPIEDALFDEWTHQSGSSSLDAFYQEQTKKAFVLKGMIDSYDRSVKNRPGDFRLINPTSRLPVAFLYSTKVNLQDYVGHEVTILVAPRHNNHFAYPAYFVLSIQ